MVRSGTRKTFLGCLGRRIKADGHNELAFRETTSFRRTSPEASEILAESQRQERKVNRTPVISYGSTLAVEWPRILTVWFNCSILSGFFRTVTGLICKILSSISLSG